MSDTHGNAALMLSAAARMVEDHHAALIYHLGDDYADAVFLEHAGYALRKVPGLWCDQYDDGRIPKTISETVAGVSIVCAHAAKDLKAIEGDAVVVLTGHTHVAKASVAGRTLHVNPGHLKNMTSRGRPASYAIIQITAAAVEASIIDLRSGGVLGRAVLARV